MNMEKSTIQNLITQIFLHRGMILLNGMILLHHGMILFIRMIHLLRGIVHIQINAIQTDIYVKMVKGIQIIIGNNDEYLYHKI